MKLYPIDSISIGERSRQELTAIDSLARSIEQTGLLQPPVVRWTDAGLTLVCGQRRIEAARKLGWTSIPVRVIESDMDELAALYAEGDENTEREPFTVAEAVRHRRRIREVESRLAKERIDAGREKSHAARRGEVGPSNLDEPKPKPHESTTRHRTAKATGYGATTLDKAEEIVTAAEDESQPEPVREVARQATEELAKPGAKVDREHKRVKQALAESLAGSIDYQAAQYRKNLSKQLAAVQALTAHDPTKVVEVSDALTFEVIDNACRSVASWHEQISKLRSRPLRVVDGGQG